MSYVLALHGGAGTIQPGDPNESAYHEAMTLALKVGEGILSNGWSALDAVTAAVTELENCPLFNAGIGSVFNADGEHELDAGVMDGRKLAAGAIAGVRLVKNPVLAARCLLDEGRVALLCGEGADRYAREQGLLTVPNEYFSTEHRRQQLLRVRAAGQQAMALDHGMTSADPAEAVASKMGTVGAVALDMDGNLAAATSTGGMTNKRPGRVGDTPVVGGGVYANNLSCAVSATGTGEAFLRACAGHDVHARVLYGNASLPHAAGATIQAVASLRGVGGLIAISRSGELAMPYNSVGMYRGWVRKGQPAKTLVFSDPRGS